MNRPAWVTNEPLWIEGCNKVVARATDLIENRLGVIICSREMGQLAYSLRAQDDPDFMIFCAIDSDSDAMPVGPERQHWSAEALIREDKKIAAFECQYRADAVAAAESLREKYSPLANTSRNTDA